MPYTKTVSKAQLEAWKRLLKAAELAHDDLCRVSFDLRTTEYDKTITKLRNAIAECGAKE